MAKYLRYSRLLQSVWRGYTYLYYRIYAANLRITGKSDFPQLKAMLAVGFLSGANLLALIFPLLKFSGLVRLLGPSGPQWFLWLCAAAWLFINYLLLVRDGKYKQIAAEFSTGKHINSRWGTLFCWCYVTLTFVILGISAKFA